MKSLFVVALLAAPAFAQDAPIEPVPTPPDPAPVPTPVAPPEPTPHVEPVQVAAPLVLVKRDITLALDLELVGQGRYTSTEGANLSELRLDRGELGARVGLGTYTAATLRLEAIRSASDGGALGIDGDSTVVRVKYAHVSGGWKTDTLFVDGALGFVPDPWIQTVEGGYTLKPLSRVGSERLLGWQTADLAALIRAGYGPARIAVSVGNGEGQRYPERNDGKTTTAVASVDVVYTDELRATVSAMGRDGSIGVARVRDRRAGGAATVVHDVARGGIEVVKAWGIGDRGDVEGLELGAWADARIVPRVHLAARLATLGYDDGRATTFGGALAFEAFSPAANAPRSPTHDPSAKPRVRFWLALDRVTSSGTAMPLPGADGGDATVVMLVASATAPFVLD